MNETCGVGLSMESLASCTGLTETYCGSAWKVLVLVNSDLYTTKNQLPDVQKLPVFSFKFRSVL